MSLNLRKSYNLFKLVKFLILVSQLTALIYFILWNFQFWVEVMPEILVHTNSGLDGVSQIFNITLPSFFSIAIFLLCLFGLFVLRRIILSISILPSTIVKYEQNNEIHPLFARRLVAHYKWSGVLTIETFYHYYLDSLEQIKNLKMHQYNKEFYDFLCKYDPSLQKDFPYQEPTNNVIIRRDENLKIDPVEE